MRKLTILLLCSAFLIMNACKKKDSTPTPTPTPASIYWFKFKLNDSTFNMHDGFAQYIFLYENEAGGYEATGNTFAPSAGLSFNVPNSDTITEAQVLGLKGKTFYFDDTAMHPNVTFDYDLSAAPGWESVDTADHSFYVTISNVTFLKRDTSIGYYLKSYVLTGTCNALMQRNGVMKVMSSGYFNFIIGKRDLK